MLHVTNGDAAGDVLREAGLDGDILPWRDVLHEGPIPAVDGAELRHTRAAFIAAEGWGDADAVEADLALRDERLHAALREPVVLWFEADLYDQLQLLQVIAQLDGLGRGPDDISIVCIDRHPKLLRFTGLGELAPGDFVELFAARTPIDAARWRLAVDTWAAVRSPDPAALVAAADLDRDAWPFVGDALRRWLLEYPAMHDGLSLTQRRILDGLHDGVHDPLRLFRRVNGQEPRPFLGDTGFFATLVGLADAEVALVEFVGGSRRAPVGQQTVTLTAAGRAALAGAHDHVLASGIDRWLGGVHLCGAPDWRWQAGPDERGHIVLR